MIFRIASSPPIHNQRHTSRIMLLVILAALPGMTAQWWYFGYGNLIQVILAALVAISAEGLILKLRRLPVAVHLKDNSALLTALLLGVSVPPLAPWWLIVLGSFFAVVVAKQLYGGLGQNLFNPAMIGYVVLLISFPVHMTSWLPPSPLLVAEPVLKDTLSMIFLQHTPTGATMQQWQMGIDGVSQATPLDTFKTGLHSGKRAEQLMSFPVYQGSIAGIGWSGVNAGFLAGGLILLLTRSIRWHIPVACLTTLALLASAGWLISPESQPSPVIHLFSGATMLGAFFIATDPVTAATTNNGRLLFGALTGLLIWLIRTFGGYPDGVAFAVLLANITVPLIDYYTRPRVYGHGAG